MDLIKPFRIMIAILLITMNLTSCDWLNNSSSNEDSSLTLMPYDFSDYLEVSYWGQIPIRIDKSIALDIQNTSMECIVFPHDFGVHIYANINGSWLEIPNSVQYPNQEDIILDPKGSFFSDSGTVVHPIISSINKNSNPIRIRVVIVGRLCKDGTPTEKQVGGYIDLDIFQ